MKLKLPIFFHNDTTEAKDKMGLGHSLSDCDIREVVFYKIDALSPHYEDGNSYTEIFTSKDSFICPYTIEKIEQLIDEQWKSTPPASFHPPM